MDGRRWMVVLLAVVAASARAACPGPPATIMDRGLHRMWLLERDCAHSDRPPRLVEIPWRETPASTTTAPVIRAGMAVIVRHRNERADILLRGVALDGGRLGQRILVRAGLSGAVVRCVVRGPGVAELEPQKGRE